MVRTPLLIVVLLIATLYVAGNGWATNGYFQHGVGIKEQSTGGAATAFPQSVLSAATNPALLNDIGQRLDLGLDWFNPSRSANKPIGDDTHISKDTDFLIPQFGYNHPLNKSLSLAIILYANGGMQTNWPTEFFGSTNTYSCLKQMIIAPTIAYQVSDRHSFGMSLNYIRQSFEARGLDGFAALTETKTTNFLSDQGEDKSDGVGIRLGYFGRITDNISVGAFWQPETRMTKFTRYHELLPEQGGMNVPATYGIGLAVKPHKQLTLAADLATIKYSDVPTLGNHNLPGTLLGSGNGPGFGWRDVNILKFGLAYQHSPLLTLRAGWNHSNSPLRSSETTLNILSPATTTDHLTLGGSWKTGRHGELSLTYWHGMGKAISGDAVSSNNADDAHLEMEQNNIGLSYSWIF